MQDFEEKFPKTLACVCDANKFIQLEWPKWKNVTSSSSPMQIQMAL